MCATALPDPQRPDGAFIATTKPARWLGGKVRILDLTPPVGTAG